MNFFHDAVRQLLIYESPHPTLLQHVEATPINGKYFAVRQTLRNSQILRHYGYPVAPVMTDLSYDWPIEPGRKPNDHQRVMANFQVLHPRSYNLSDPGTQKTLAALWSAEFLMRQHPPGKCRCLIVGPLNVIETVWANTIFTNFLGRRTFEILHGTADKRSQLLAKKTDFAIINIDGVSVGAHTRNGLRLDGFCQELADDEAIKIVIVDEADGYVAANLKRSRVARMVFGNKEYCWGMTGTPTAQRPTDAYGIAKLVTGAQGKSFTSFRNETMYQIPGRPFKWFPKPDGYEKARQLLVPAVRFSIEETWKDAPPLTTQQRTIALTEDQKKAIGSLKRDLQVTMRSGAKINALNEASSRMKLIQILLGGVYDENHKSHEIDAGPRYEEVERIIASTQRKVLIFVPLTNVVNLLYKRLSMKWRCKIINGHVDPKHRPGIIKAFAKEPDLKIMIADPQSTAHGINDFVVADTVIWLVPIDKTRLYIQGNRRAHRPGQKYPVTVYQLVATALEKEMYRRLETNTSQQGVLLEAVRRGEL